MADELEKAEDFDRAVHDLIKKTVTEHQRIVFNGNGYADAWVEEAERRGLPNLNSMVSAVPALVSEKAIKLFDKHHVLTTTELKSRVEVLYESYSKAINIEAKTMIEMASRMFIPAVIKFTTTLANSINAVKTALPTADVSVQTDLLAETSTLLKQAKVALNNLTEYTKTAASLEGEEQANYFRNLVFPAMDELRAPIDLLETMVDKDVWPVPTYGDLLFEV